MSDGARKLVRNASLLGGVLLAALLLAAAVVRLPPIQRWTAARVSARLPAGVSVERAIITLLRPGVRLTQVSLPGGSSTLQSVTCHLSIAALLGGRIEVRTIRINGANMTIERQADGTLQLFGPGAPGRTEAPPSASAASFAPLLDALPAVLVKNATVTIVDRGALRGPRALQFRAVRFALGAATAGAMPLTLSARLDPAGRINAQGTLRPVVSPSGRGTDQAISVAATATGLDAQTVLGHLAAAVPGGGSAKANGALDASLTLAGSLSGGLAGNVTLSQAAGSLVWDEVHFSAPLKLVAQVTAGANGLALSEGQLTAAQLVAARVTATDLDAEFAYAAYTINLSSARATVYGGAWTQSGTVTLADPPDFNTTLHGDGIGCNALLTALTGATPQYGCEQLSVDAVVRGHWTGAKTVVRSAEGNGSVTLRGGTIPASSIIGAVWQAFVPLLHTGKEPSGLAAPTRVDHLTQSFALQAARLQTGDLTLVTDDYTITGTGSVGLDGSLDLDTEIAMTPEGVTKLLTMASLPIPGELGTLPPIPTRITGSVNFPIIRPEVDHLSIAAVQTLFEDARSAGDMLEGAAGSGVRTLQHGLDSLW